MELKSRDARSYSSDGEFYTWKFPGVPVRIRISLDIVEKLRDQVMAAARPEDGPGAEVGGLLLGSAAPSHGEVEVSDFQPLRCDDIPGGRFAITTPADVELLEQAISAERNGLSVVGYYRSHLRDGLRLDERDLTISRIWFSSPTNVFLVMKPSDGGSCDAGFFFWDGDQIQSSFSFMEFPFEASLLRRLSALEAKPVEAEVPMARAEEPAEAPRPAPVVPAHAAPPKSNVLFWLLVATLLLLTVAVGVGFFLYREGVIGGVSDVVSGQEASLGLRAENRGGDLAITWDRNSPDIRSGRSGTLVIWDGEQPKQDIPLDTTQLRSASILYAPQTDRIQFRLEVEGDRKATESVLAILRGRARPATGLRTEPDPPAQPYRAPQLRPPSQAAEAGANPAQPAPLVREAEPQPAARQVRTFVPPPTPAPAAAPIRTLYLDPPAVSSSPSISGSAQLATLSQTRLPDPPPPAPQPPPEAKPKPAVSPPVTPPAAVPTPARPAEPKRVAVTYAPPRPVRQVPPSVPNQLLRALVAGDTRVEVAAQVDSSGRVTDARIVSGTAHRLLVNAITEAAKKWNFEPARLDGKPVNGEARIVFLLRDPRGGGAK